MLNLLRKAMVKDTFFTINTSFNFGGKIVDLSQPKVMGIINITPDSFYQSSRFVSNKEILAEAEKHLNEGADFLDLGAFSTRPKADYISEEEELNRLIEPISLIKKTFPNSIISVDTFRAKVAEIAIDNGANLINDVSGGMFDLSLFKVLSKYNIPYILMHNKGEFKTMHQPYIYDNIIAEITQYFIDKISELKEFGLTDIILDPGFGFAKNSEQNFDLLSQLDCLKIFEKPVLVGISRKSMIWKNLNSTSSEALNGTTILNTIALTKGAKLLRVHDVKEAKECIKLLELLNQSN